MGIQQYRAAQRQADTPQQSEYRLLADITRRLMAIDDVKAPEAVETLYDNSAAWSTFATDVALPENPLPDALKAQIVSLYLWVERHTRQVVKGAAQVSPLVDVNKAIMAGLAAQAANAGATGAGQGQGQDQPAAPGQAAASSPGTQAAAPAGVPRRPSFLDSA